MAYEENEQAQSGDAAEAVESTDPATKALVERWCKKMREAREHPPTKAAFERMRKNMELAARGAEKSWIEAGKYVVPILVRYINQAVSQLYAKNPTASVSRKRRLMYQVWDGRTDTLQAAMEMAAFGDPNAMAIIEEVQGVVQNEQMLDRMAKTLEALWEYYVNEQAFDYKQQIKAAVRRTKVCGVAYAKLGFQRIMEPRPEVMSQIEDVTSKIEHLQALLKDAAEGEIEDESATMAEMTSLLADLETQKEFIAREGPVFDFPRADEVLIDPCCRHLKSLAGAEWIAFYYDMDPDRVEEVYGVDVSKTHQRYNEPREDAKGKPEGSKARVYEIWDKKNQQVMAICEGHPDFLKAPAEPDLKLERFWPLFPLVFNEIEHESEIYPPSDIENARHIQYEYNRSREALREHREASRPWWVTGGQVEAEELKKIGNHSAQEVVTLKALAAGGKVNDLLMAGPTAPIDPNLYEVEMHFTDLMRTVGVQEASLGAVAGGTATESSIAEQSRSASLADNVDDLDAWLTEIAKATGQLMLMEVSKERVLEIVGPGAVWPDMPATREEVVKDLLLEIKAGSSGRPNRAAELANMERAGPVLTQIPGLNPAPIGRRYLELLDIPIEEATAEGMPSITAMNALMAKMAAGAGANPTGDPATDPNQQGGQGAQNAPRGMQNEPGGQPSYQEPIPTPA